MAGILSAFMELGSTVIIPLHPRTRQRMAQSEQLFERFLTAANLKFIEPVSYIDMLALEQNAKLILTDSGGMQKEAFFLGVPCVTLRPETEWVETVSAGWNIVADVQPENILRAAQREDWPTQERTQAFGGGDAAARIVAVLEGACEMRSQADTRAREAQPEQTTA
jgi:UDP-N-acetylglucosamine 2-epimerase